MTHRRTHPLHRSAPLPVGMVVSMPHPELLLDEIKRASTELMWATHRHRKAWARMARLKEIADLKGTSWYMDNEREWKIATGDVTWWRGEISSRSNALTAMLALATAYGLELHSGYAETTTFGDLNQGRRTWMSTEREPSVDVDELTDSPRARRM